VTANIIPDTHQSNGNAPVISVPFWLENCLVDCTSNSCWWLVSCLWQIRLLSHTHEHPSSAERITINQLKQNSEQHKANTWKHMQNIKTGFLQFRHRRHADQDAQGIKQEGNAPSPANYGVYGAFALLGGSRTFWCILASKLQPFCTGKQTLKVWKTFLYDRTKAEYIYFQSECKASTVIEGLFCHSMDIPTKGFHQ